MQHPRPQRLAPRNVKPKNNMNISPEAQKATRANPSSFPLLPHLWGSVYDLFEQTKEENYRELVVIGG